mgnify:FL=1|jgi:uncharacterized membrane protein
MKHPLLEKATPILKWLGGIRINLRLALAAICAIGILHICATLAAPMLMMRSAFDRLSPQLPVNETVVFPPVMPGSQPIPFMTPDVRYAMCRYDTSDAPVIVTAELPDLGWSLALHTPDGDNIYAATGVDVRRTNLRIRILPANERFMGLTPEALGMSNTSEKPQTLRSARGIVALRAPDKGRAYQPLTEAALRRFRCSTQKVQ